MRQGSFCYIDGTPVLETQNLTKYYSLGKQNVRALDGVDFTAVQGDFAVINGPSGSGKTTLLNMLALIDRPSEGEVLFEEKPTSRLTEGELALLRREKIGLVFQTFNLIPVLSVAENVEYPLLLTKTPRGERRERVAERLDEVGLSGFGKRRPDELSGGQRQRVAVARALVTQPRLVLADEPTANLDSATGKQIMGLLQGLNTDHCVTFLVVTHDPSVVGYAQRVLTIRDGRIQGEEKRGAPRPA